jgi:protoporphyrinogen oxidase
MAWLWARIHIRANSREKGDSGEKLGYFNGGFDVFTEKLVQKLTELGVGLHAETQVGNLKQETSGVSLMIDGEQQTFDHILATVPSQVFPRLLADTESSKVAVKDYTSQLQSIPYLGAALYIFSSDQDITPYYWHNINDVSKTFLVLINNTKLIDKSTYSGKYVYYIGAYLSQDHELMKCSEETLIATWQSALKEMLPEFDAAKISEEHIFRFANAQHIVMPGYRPPAYQTPLSNVYLANFSQIFPEDRGTNYAVREGKKIARMIIDSDTK